MDDLVFALILRSGQFPGYRWRLTNITSDIVTVLTLVSTSFTSLSPPRQPNRLAVLGLQMQALDLPLSMIPEAAAPFVGQRLQRQPPGRGLRSSVPGDDGAGTSTLVWNLPPPPDERCAAERSSDGSGRDALAAGRLGRQALHAVRASSPISNSEITTSPSHPSSLAPPPLLLSAAWRSICTVAIPQLQAMLRQTRVSMALVMVMSAISLEAGDVWEARRGLKRQPLAPEAGNRKHAANGITEQQVQNHAARATSLVRHVASLHELFASSPSGLPDEAAVMGLLRELRVARIQAAAREMLQARLRRLQTPAALSSSAAGSSHKESVGASSRSALGLPSLMLRKRGTAARGIANPSTGAGFSPIEEPSADGHDDELGAAGAPSAAAASILEQLASRAQQYSRGFAALSANRRAARKQQQAVVTAAVVSGPAGIPALPSRRPRGGMKARRQAQAHLDKEMWKKSLQSLA